MAEWALYYADFISFYTPTQLCGGGTTKSNSNELPISVPLSFKVENPIFRLFFELLDFSSSRIRKGPICFGPFIVYFGAMTSKPPM